MVDSQYYDIGYCNHPACYGEDSPCWALGSEFWEVDPRHCHWCNDRSHYMDHMCPAAPSLCCCHIEVIAVGGGRLSMMEIYNANGFSGCFMSLYLLVFC